MNRHFSRSIAPHVLSELKQATNDVNERHFEKAFTHLEAAHIMGQASTRWHTLTHWHMLLWGIKVRDAREVRGQLLRLIGAATKTMFGLIPKGNTGGSNVSPFKVMPMSPSLSHKIKSAQSKTD